MKGHRSSLHRSSPSLRPDHHHDAYYAASGIVDAAEASLGPERCASFGPKRQPCSPLLLICLLSLLQAAAWLGAPTLWTVNGDIGAPTTSAVGAASQLRLRHGAAPQADRRAAACPAAAAVATSSGGDSARFLGLAAAAALAAATSSAAALADAGAAEPGRADPKDGRLPWWRGGGKSRNAGIEEQRASTQVIFSIINCSRGGECLFFIFLSIPPH